MSVTKLRFDTDSIDVTVCTEVLEHLTPEHFELALSELRRVTRKQLLMTVPYREAEPLFRAHKQSFDDQKLRSLFPNAHLTVLGRTRGGGFSWILIEERLDGASLEHRVMPIHRFDDCLEDLEPGNRKSFPFFRAFRSARDWLVKPAFARSRSLTPREAEVSMHKIFYTQGIDQLLLWAETAIRRRVVNEEYVNRILFDLLRRDYPEKALVFGKRALLLNPSNAGLQVMLEKVESQQEL